MHFKAHRITPAHHFPSAVAVAGIATVLLIVAIMAVAILQMLPN